MASATSALRHGRELPASRLRYLGVGLMASATSALRHGRELPASRLRYLGVAVVVLAAILVTGCSGGDDTGSGEDPASETTLTSIAAVVTTTTIEGTPMSGDEVYADAGLTPDQGRCIAESGVDGDFAITRGASPADPLVLESDDATIEVPATITTGAELELLMLQALASDCAPLASLERLASIDGAALDSAALDEDLPLRMLYRRAAGANPEEVSCIEAAFREAPVRLSSLAALPEMVEVTCVSVARLGEWRRFALDAGLTTAGATEAERQCLIAEPEELALLGEAVVAVESGDVSGLAEPAEPPTCASFDRLTALAVEVVAKHADFGVEALVG